MKRKDDSRLTMLGTPVAMLKKLSDEFSSYLDKKKITTKKEKHLQSLIAILLSGKKLTGQNQHELMHVMAWLLNEIKTKKSQTKIDKIPHYANQDGNIPGKLYESILKNLLFYARPQSFTVKQFIEIIKMCSVDEVIDLGRIKNFESSTIIQAYVQVLSDPTQTDQSLKDKFSALFMTYLSTFPEEKTDLAMFKDVERNELMQSIIPLFKIVKETKNEALKEAIVLVVGETRLQRDFLKYAQAGDLEGVKALIVHWPDEAVSEAQKSLFFRAIAQNQPDIVRLIAQQRKQHTAEYFSEKIRAFDPMRGTFEQLASIVHTEDAALEVLRKIALVDNVELFNRFVAYIDSKVLSNKMCLPLTAVAESVMEDDAARRFAAYVEKGILPKKYQSSICNEFMRLPLTEATRAGYLSIVKARLLKPLEHDNINYALTIAVNLALQEPSSETKNKIFECLFAANPSSSEVAQCLGTAIVSKNAKVAAPIVKKLASKIDILEREALNLFPVSRSSKAVQKRQVLDLMVRGNDSLLVKTLATPENKQKLALDILSHAMAQAIQLSTSKHNRFTEIFLYRKEEKFDLLYEIRNSFDKGRKTGAPIETLVKLAKTFSDTAHLQRGLTAARSGRVFDAEVGASLIYLESILPKAPERSLRR